MKVRILLLFALPVFLLGFSKGGSHIESVAMQNWPVKCVYGAVKNKIHSLWIHVEKFSDGDQAVIFTDPQFLNLTAYETTVRAYVKKSKPMGQITATFKTADDTWQNHAETPVVKNRLEELRKIFLKDCGDSM